MRVFSVIRFHVTPVVNAISTVMLLLTLTAILASQALIRRAGRGRTSADGQA